MENGLKFRLLQQTQLEWAYKQRQKAMEEILQWLLRLGMAWMNREVVPKLTEGPCEKIVQNGLEKRYIVTSTLAADITKILTNDVNFA